MVEPRITFISLAFIVAISIGIFLSLILFLTRRRNPKANIFLSLLIFSFYFLQIWDVLIQTRQLINFPYMIMVLNPLVFVLGPLIYFYVSALTRIHWKFKTHSLLHFIPAVVFYIFFIPVYLLNTNEKIQIITDSFLNGKPIIPHLFFVIAVIQILVYLIYSLLLLVKHSKNIKNNFSYTERLSLNWLRFLLIIFIIVWLTFAIRVFYNSQVMWDISASISLLTIFILGYYGYNQPVIYQNAMNEKLVDINSNVKKKYATSTLSNEEATNALKKMKKLMDDEKLYLQNELTLGDIAERMNLPVYYVSQVINEYLKKNFYDFVNEFRVEEVKKRIADKKYNHITILAIGYDSGFNSKSAFYSAFKKNTNVTPSEFKKHLLAV